MSDKVLPAQSYDGNTYYYTNENRKQVARFSAEKDVETLITGKDFVSVSVDRFEWVYTAEAKSAEIRAVGKNGEL
ncbi:LpqB family beta-propeller domain-containing protein, partial [Brevibacterium paucivorans]|uniref:LpqB family beta-propeller domain-containing protein n=1 Tax=Brevibacterium paucivorans TaxID=170994 RepID=UPI001C935E18